MMTRASPGMKRHGPGPRFVAQLLFTVLVCAFLVVPVVLSVLAGLSENFFVGVRSGLTLRWVGQV